MEISKELISYIKLSREARVQEYFIRQALLDIGWDRNLIDKAMDSEEAWPAMARVDVLGPKD